MGHRILVHKGIYTTEPDNVNNYIKLANLRTSVHLLKDKEEKLTNLKGLKVNPRVRMAPQNVLESEIIPKNKYSKPKSVRKIVRSRYEGMEINYHG